MDDLFDLIDNPQAGQKAEPEPFNWEKFVNGKPAVTRWGHIGYYGGPADALHKNFAGCYLIVCATKEVSSRCLVGHDTVTFVITKEGYWIENRRYGGPPDLISMA